MQHNITTYFIIVSIFVLVTVFSPQPSFSQIPEGTKLKTLNFFDGYGLTVAFDGNLLYYTTAGSSLSSELARTTTDGVRFSNLNLNGCSIDALTFDSTRDVFWGSSGATQTIYTIDPDTGNCTQEFTFSVNPAPCTGCDVIDGISFDYTDDTLWLSFDQSPKIFHFMLDGTPLPTIFIGSPDSFVPDCNSNMNSGIAIGGEILYLAHLHCDNVIKFDKNGNKIGSFFVGKSKEDMACDNVTFAEFNTDAIWIANPLGNNEMELVAFAVAPGTCFGVPGPNYYPVKFHCGDIPDFTIEQSINSGIEVAPLKPGNYNTAIDVYGSHNTLSWKIISSLPGPPASATDALNTILLEDEAIEIDCTDIRQRWGSYASYVTYPEFVKGFVLIYGDVDVTATYTYREQPDNPTWWFWLPSGLGGSIDVETIHGKPLFDSHDVNIVPHCSNPSISINDATIIETDSGFVDMVFTISLSMPSLCDVTVMYTSNSFTALSPNDFTSITQTTMIPAGSSFVQISIPIAGDTIPESTETFNVLLSNAVNGIIGDNTGIGTIQDNDMPTGSFIINGSKFFDADSSNSRQTQNPFEAGLVGWNVTLFDSSNNKIDSMLTQSDTDPLKHGWFSFIVPTGTYKICEKDDRPGFWETLPYPGFTPNWDYAPLPTSESTWHPYCYSIVITNSDSINNLIGNNDTLSQ